MRNLFIVIICMCASVVTANAQKATEKPTLATSSKSIESAKVVNPEKAPTLGVSEKLPSEEKKKKIEASPEKKNTITTPKLGVMDKKEKKQN